MNSRKFSGEINSFVKLRIYWNFLKHGKQKKLDTRNSPSWMRT